MKRLLISLLISSLFYNIASAEKAGGTLPHCRVNKKSFVNIYADVDGEVTNQMRGMKEYVL